jgi:hypothetical protein
MRACVYTSVCLSFQPLNLSSNFHETGCEHYDIAGHPTAMLFRYLQLNNSMTDKQTFLGDSGILFAICTSTFSKLYGK